MTVRIKLAPVLDDGRDLLERNLNRDLAEGVHLSMDVKSGRVLSVRAAPAALLVRAIASGQGELVLDLRRAARRPGEPQRGGFTLRPLSHPDPDSSGEPEARATWSAFTFPGSNRRAAAVIFSIVSSKSAFTPRWKRSGLMRATTKARR
jgi:hypothetical protein